MGRVVNEGRNGGGGERSKKAARKHAWLHGKGLGRGRKASRVTSRAVAVRMIRQQLALLLQEAEAAGCAIEPDPDTGQLVVLDVRGEDGDTP